MAREDAQFYVLSQGSPGDTISEDDFYQTGRRLVDRVLSDAPPAATDLAVEIGCGVGRNLFPMAERFGRAVGFDVSPEMARLTNEHERRPGNAEARAIAEPRLAGIEDGAVDLVLCVIVFQHIPDWGVIEAYLHEAGRVLREGGVAALHFDTRRPSLARRAYMALPDALLPKIHRRGMRRHPRAAALVRDAIGAAGLTIGRERGQGTDGHWFYCGKGGQA